jgi:hypothetical protein
VQGIKGYQNHKIYQYIIIFDFYVTEAPLSNSLCRAKSCWFWNGLPHLSHTKFDIAVGVTSG